MRVVITLLFIFVTLILSNFLGGIDSSYAGVSSGERVILTLNKSNMISSKFFNNQGQLVVDSGIKSPLIITSYATDVLEPELRSNKKYSKMQLYCLAKNIYFEARGEGDKGMRAVAYTTLNRTNSTYFPSAICSVVYEGRRNKFGALIRNRCQFSWACDGQPHIIKNRRMWNKSKAIANEVALSYDRKDDPTFGALFYHTASISHKRPFRKMNVAITTQIGHHIFYRKGYV